MGVKMTFEEDLKRILDKGAEESAVDMIKIVEDAYGEVPYIFQVMKENPELLITKMLHNNAILRSSKSLDMRTIELISIAVSAAIRCSHCLKVHIRVASRMGITDDEIAATIFLAGNLVNASVLATATREFDGERDVCRTCQIGSEACEIKK